MGNITELSKGSYEGLKKQVCECIENAYNAGLKKGLENLKNTRPEETENYKLGYRLGYEKGERHKKELWETALNEAKADGYKTGYDAAIENSQGRREGFDNGYNKGYDRGYGVGFNEGLENAWELVRAIHDLDVDEREGLYGYCLTYKVVEKFDVHKAFEIYKNYEQSKREVQEKAEKEIKVGDIVVWEDGRKDFPFIVTQLKNQTYTVMNREGGFTYFARGANMKKIGNVSDKLQTLIDKLTGDK